MAVTGRPTKLTPLVKKKLLEATIAGATLKAAAAYAGIHRDTLAVWRAENEQFAEEMQRAEGMAAVGHTFSIKKCSDGGDWRAAAWWLERRCADEWAKRDELALTGKDGGPIRHEHGFTLDIERCTAEELEVIERAMLRQMALAPGESEEVEE